MALTSVEIMALIIALLAAIKILVILINPKAWGNVVNAVYGNPLVTTLIAFILAAVVLNYLLAEMSIVQIFAVMLFLSLLMTIGAAAYSKEMLKIVNNLLKNKKILKKAWFYILVWIVLIIWVILEIL